MLVLSPSLARDLWVPHLHFLEWWVLLVRGPIFRYYKDWKTMLLPVVHPKLVGGLSHRLSRLWIYRGFVRLFGRLWFCWDFFIMTIWTEYPFFPLFPSMNMDVLLFEFKFSPWIKGYQQEPALWVSLGLLIALGTMWHPRRWFWVVTKNLRPRFCWVQEVFNRSSRPHLQYQKSLS